ncbi:MAG: hypothetical protein KAR21_18830, partial [Spirochaetales bacterium]|nr:hypothetical protein [Spirochaetales bacterium]
MSKDKEEAGDTISLDELETAAENGELEKLLDSAISENNSNSRETGDPVRVTTGAFTTSEVDLEYSFANILISLKRTYLSSNKSSHSFGLGWTFNYDTRIVLGVKVDAVAIREQAKIEADEALAIYNNAVVKYNQSLADLEELIGSDDGTIKGLLYTWKEELESAIVALEHELTTENAVKYAKVRGIINKYIEETETVLYENVIPLIARTELARSNLEASWPTVVAIGEVEQQLREYYEQMTREATLALSNETRNQHVLNNSDPEYQQMTGNGTITWIDESGSPHMYTIDCEPDYYSPILYDDGSINYFPSGSTTTPQLPNDEELYLSSEGEYILTSKDKSKYNLTFYGQLYEIVDTNNNTIEFNYNEMHELTHIIDGFDRVTSVTKENGRITNMIDPEGRESSFNYDIQG